MKHKVNKVFTDKESGELFLLGSPYVSDNYERVKELEKLGFIKANEDVESLKVVVEKQPTKKKATTRKKASDDNGRDSTKG